MGYVPVVKNSISQNASTSGHWDATAAVRAVLRSASAIGASNAGDVMRSCAPAFAVAFRGRTIGGASRAVSCLSEGGGYHPADF
jgi:hypothetical protein